MKINLNIEFTFKGENYKTVNNRNNERRVRKEWRFSPLLLSSFALVALQLHGRECA